MLTTLTYGINTLEEIISSLDGTDKLVIASVVAFLLIIAGYVAYYIEDFRG